MKKFNAFCRYIGYATISVFIGYVSYLSGQKYDYLFKISGNLVPILISLLVFYVTIFGSILKELCFIARGACETLTPNTIKLFIAIVSNSITVFSIIYFLLAIYDSILGLWDLIETNNKK